MNLLQKLGQQALFSFDAETAHGMSIRALKTGMVPSCPGIVDHRLSQKIAGLEFPNPVGLAAGYDKNAEVADAILSLGFGFTEVGTLTPRAQSGNPKPRVFRLVEHKGVINRLGFNNVGVFQPQESYIPERSEQLVSISEKHKKSQNWNAFLDTNPLFFLALSLLFLLD